MRKARSAGLDHLGSGLDVAQVGGEEGAPRYRGLTEFEDQELGWPEYGPGAVS